MESGRISTQVCHLRDALDRSGVVVPGPLVLEEIVAEWNRQVRGPVPPVGGRPFSYEGGVVEALAALDSALRGSGIQLDLSALSRVLWALLGVPAAGQLRLGAARWSRLTHLTELHDVSLPSAARTLARQLGHEPHLVPDLRRARPWLDQAESPQAEAVMTAIFQTEWTGFLALLGEFGPWVYAPSVADLQTLSHLYARLVHLAAGSPESEVLAAAFQLSLSGQDLLVRLEATDYRRPSADQTAAPLGGQTSPRLVEAEMAFWDATEDQARQRYTVWVARRGDRR